MKPSNDNRALLYDALIFGAAGFALSALGVALCEIYGGEPNSDPSTVGRYFHLIGLILFLFADYKCARLIFRKDAPVWGLSVGPVMLALTFVSFKCENNDRSIIREHKLYTLTLLALFLFFHNLLLYNARLRALRRVKADDPNFNKEWRHSFRRSLVWWPAWIVFPVLPSVFFCNCTYYYECGQFECSPELKTAMSIMPKFYFDALDRFACSVRGMGEFTRSAYLMRFGNHSHESYVRGRAVSDARMSDLMLDETPHEFAISWLDPAAQRFVMRESELAMEWGASAKLSEPVIQALCVNGGQLKYAHGRSLGYIAGRDERKDILRVVGSLSDAALYGFIKSYRNNWPYLKSYLLEHENEFTSRLIDKHPDIKLAYVQIKCHGIKDLNDWAIARQYLDSENPEIHQAALIVVTNKRDFITKNEMNVRIYLDLMDTDTDVLIQNFPRRFRRYISRELQFDSGHKVALANKLHDAFYKCGNVVLQKKIAGILGTTLCSDSRLLIPPKFNGEVNTVEVTGPELDDYMREMKYLIDNLEADLTENQPPGS